MGSASDKQVVFKTETQPDGSLKIEVSIGKENLWGKEGTFVIKRTCTVKDRRPVNEDISLYSVAFVAKSSPHTFIVPVNRLKSTVGGYPYNGAKIKIETKAEIIFTKFLGFKTKFHTSICYALPGSLPHRAKVSNNANELINPADSFKFFKNLSSPCTQRSSNHYSSASPRNCLCIGNAFVGYHDQISPEHLTWFYSHINSDGESQSPLFNSLMLSSGILGFTWFLVRKELKRYMSFHFKMNFHTKKINRDSQLLVSDMVTGISRVNLYDATLRVVACNMECGQYVRGYGSNRRTVSFRNPNRAVLLYSKKVPLIEKGHPLDKYFADAITFKPMFQSLYPQQMVGGTHGLDLDWEVQLLVDDLVDQELIGSNARFEKRDFYSA